MGGRSGVSAMKTELPHLSRENNSTGRSACSFAGTASGLGSASLRTPPAFAKAYSDALDALEKPFEAAERERKEAAKAGTMGWLATRYFAECEEYKGIDKKSRNARRS
jgi:hypothetical protein